MLIAGLTGGLASGKTFDGSLLQEMGASVVEADALGHEVLQPGERAFEAVVAGFGAGILDAAGRIDRRALARIVFGDPAALARLNAIVHPAVRERAVREFREIGATDARALIVYVAAILVEAGSARDFDKLIVVGATREQQIERALARGTATEAEVLARLNSQLPLSEKAAFADYLIDTSGTKEETLRQTKLVYEALHELALRKTA